MHPNACSGNPPQRLRRGSTETFLLNIYTLVYCTFEVIDPFKICSLPCKTQIRNLIMLDFLSILS